MIFLTMENFEGVRHVIQMGATLTSVDKVGRTALHYLMSLYEGGNLLEELILQESIKITYDIDAQTRGGVTPLMLAVKLNFEKNVEILLENGANPFLKDKLG